jgi:HK97 family phage major capsid protein
MKEAIEKLQTEIVELNRFMAEKAAKGQDEYKELADKLEALMKEQADRKHQFAMKTEVPADKREVETKMDELFIASALCTDLKTGKLNQDAYGKVASEYRDALKGSGYTVDAQTTVDGNGGDFVPSGFSSTMLTDIYLALEIAGLFKRIPMPNPTYIFPFSADRITARKTAEAAAPEKDTVTTDQIIFTAKKIMANVEFTDELEMDSIVAILPFVRERLVEAFALAQEQIALNGCVGNTLNGGTSVVGADDARRAQDGIRQLLNANEMVDFASGGFSADNLRALRTRLGKYGKNPSDLAYIISMADYMKALGFTGYQALYQYAGAVTTTGELGRIDNIPLVITELIPTNLNASGVYDAVGTKTTCGLVNKKAYMWGDRKQFGLETYRNPFNQTMNLVGSERLDFKKIHSATAPTAAFGINY